MSTTRHPVTIPGCSLSARESGRAVARLRFDAMIQFFLGFLEELRLIARKDTSDGKMFLAAILFDAIDRVPPLLRCLREALRVSRKPMKEEFEEIPEILEN
jgi:hypothetical protein